MQHSFTKWLLLALVLSYSPAYAFFPIDVEEQLNELDITYETQSVTTVANLYVSNNTQKIVFCRTVFHNGPETPKIWRGEILPKQIFMFSASFKRDIIRVKIDLTCSDEAMLRNKSAKIKKRSE